MYCENLFCSPTDDYQAAFFLIVTVLAVKAIWDRFQ
jgi:hypothetical protein